MVGIKVLHLISEKPPVPSGFSRVIGRLAEELTRMGHYVDVVSASDCYTKIVGDMKLVIKMDKADKLMRYGGYDVVNVHGHTPTFSDRLFIKAKFLGLKTVYTLHCPADGYALVGAVYNSFFNNVLLRLADAVIVTSRSYYNWLRFPLRKYVVPWGVDYEALTGRRIPHNGYILLFVGQMRHYKGLAVLLRAIYGLDAELRVVGDGPYRTKYENYAEKLGLDNVRFYGAVGDEELKEMLLGSDVLVLPSVNRSEAFGLVTLEAAAAGCAVVASDLPGVRDVVKDFGVLVKPKDYKSLRKALEALRDEYVRRTYVNKGLKAAARYSWRKVACQYERIYFEVLKGENSGLL